MITEPRAFRSRTINLLASSVLLLFAVGCGAAGIAGLAESEPQEQMSVGILAGVVIIFLLIGAIRVFTVGILVTPEGLTIRELLYTKKLPWAWLLYCEVPTSSARNSAVLNPTIYYQNPADPQYQIAVEDDGTIDDYDDEEDYEEDDHEEEEVSQENESDTADDRIIPRSVTITALGSYRQEKAQRLADEINELIRRHQALHQTIVQVPSDSK